MGRAGITTAPLLYWVAPEWFAHPEMLKRMTQGHKVFSLDNPNKPGPPDVILHVAAHAWHETMFDAGYLPAVEAAARARRRKKGKQS